MIYILIVIFLVVILIYYKFNKNVENYEEDDIIKTELPEKDFVLEKRKKDKHKNVYPYFTDAQFHNDYRDVVNIFDTILPDKNQLFNVHNLPLTVHVPSKKEITPLIKRFIKEINNKIKNSDKLNYGWSDVSYKRYEDGYEQQMEKLGIPPKLYNEPQENDFIKLIKIDKSEKLETDDETKYTTYIIIQKNNVDVQLIVKLSFFIDKKDVNLERDFFNNSKIDLPVKIEDIFIVGFLTKNDFGEKSERERYYDMTKIDNGNSFSQEEIMKQLLNKKKQLVYNVV